MCCTSVCKIHREDLVLNRQDLMSQKYFYLKNNRTETTIDGLHQQD